MRKVMRKVMRELILVRGVSGSGKTRLARMICNEAKCSSIARISADDYFYNRDQIYVFDLTKLPEAHLWCQNKVDREMQVKIIKMPEMTRGTRLIIVDNTFTQDWEMYPYFKLAKKHDYIITTVIVENRHGSKSIHDLPDEVVEKQRKRFDIKL